MQLNLKLHQLWIIALSLNRFQLSVFLKIIWVFWLEHVSISFLGIHFLSFPFVSISFLGNSFWMIKLNSIWTVLLLPLCEEQLWLFWFYRGENGTDMKLPDPVGKTPITSWPFRMDLKHFTWRGLKLSDGKLLLLRKNPTQWSTDKNSGLPAIFGVLFMVWDCVLI